MAEPQHSRLSDLGALRVAVAQSPTLGTVLDESWFGTVEASIRDSATHPERIIDPSGFLYEFCHPLRGDARFEKAQRLALAARMEEVDEDDRLGLFFAGIDPLITILPRLESRLAAFSNLPFKVETVQAKLQELRSARFLPSFRNHLFELNVLGDLATKGVLVDIEHAEAGVDGVVRIGQRKILVEATNTTQQVIPSFEGGMFMDPGVEIDQVVYKIRRKVAEGRQLGQSAGRPTVLYLARRHLGAGRESAQIALRECFATPQFSALSGVVLADSWKLYKTSWHKGIRPDVPLDDVEATALGGWYGAE